MRFRPALALALSACAVTAAPAAAAVPHTVAPGESLWSIAAANGFTTRALAAYDGLPENGAVVLGHTIRIPTVAEAAGTMQAAGMDPGATSTRTASHATSGSTTTQSATSWSSAPGPMGGYIVQPGDTLSGLAARSGVSPQQMAYMNGLAADAHLVAGTALKLPTGSPVTSSAPPSPTAYTTSARPAAPAAAPHPTESRLSSSEIGSVADANGVPGSLAAAVAWQESGFNNGMVSTAGAGA